MTTVRTIATHDVVATAYPRPVTERDEIGMAAGKAIDEALSRFSYEYSQSRRATFTAMGRWATEVLDAELADADVQLSVGQRDQQLAEVFGVLRAFRNSELMGLTRPRSRMILINEQIGVYAQPDYWDGKDRFYEMKSYQASPMPPDVRLQIQLFQCAFPGFRAFLASFDRHATPVSTSIEPVEPPAPAARDTVLKLAFQTGVEKGTAKVLEYIDNPAVRYSIDL
ncbi:MAG: hypothetical protein WA691_04115 [Thermoplasmata archaeon]